MIRKYGGVHGAKLMSKSELIQKIAEQHSNNITRKDVKAVIESFATIGYKELNKSGAFLVPEFAKFVVIKKPATKERSGINPFTKEPTIFKAKPARKIVRARPVKGCQRCCIVVSNSRRLSSRPKNKSVRHQALPSSLKRRSALTTALGHKRT